MRVPASYCGIYGFRPSHGLVSTSGVTPMAQSFDTVGKHSRNSSKCVFLRLNVFSGWFARDPVILKKVGRILLQLREDNAATIDQLIVAEDCFDLVNIPSHQLKDVLTTSVEKLYGSKPLTIISIHE